VPSSTLPCPVKLNGSEAFYPLDAGGAPRVRTTAFPPVSARSLADLRARRQSLDIPRELRLITCCEYTPSVCSEV